MSVYADLRADLRYRFTNMAAPPVFLWEDRPDDPPAGVPWAKEHLIPIKTDVTTLGYDGHTDETILYGFDIHFPLGYRLADAETLVDRFLYVLPVGTLIGPTHIWGRVTGTSRGQLRRPDDTQPWKAIRVDIALFARRTTQYMPEAEV